MSKEFKIILIVFFVVAFICAVVYFSLGNPDDIKKSEEIDTSENTKEDLKSSIPDGIVLENEEVDIEDENLTFNVNVINKSNKSIELKEVNVIIKVKNWLITLYTFF